MDLGAQLAALAEDDEEESAPKEEKKLCTVSSRVEVEAPKSTCILVCGSTDWSTVVKGCKIKAKGAPVLAEAGEEFNAPVRIHGPLDGIRVLSLGVGPCAAHCFALATEGRVFAWGLNTSGQLGLGDGSPEVVPGPQRAALWEKKGGIPVKAACGRTHTLLCYENGAMYSCGAGAKGALGYGVRKSDLKDISPAPIRVVSGDIKDSTKICDVAAGADFSLAISKDGKLYSWGWTEFGKLGHGDDGCYNTKASSIKLTYTAEGSPKRVRIPRDDSPEANVVSCSAGKNHAACVCADGKGMTWGDGAYGKLGHRSQEQIVRPRLLEMVRFSCLYCGDMSTCGLGWAEYHGRAFTKPDTQGMLYAWGVLKGTHGEGATRPVPEYELQGWQMTPATLSMGASHISVWADNVTIAWAQSGVAFGQLGYGEQGPKSSNKPQKLRSLEGAVMCQVVASAGTTHFLADADNDTIKGLPEWEPPKATAPALDANADPAAAKKAAAAAKKPPPKKKAAPKKKAEPAAKKPPAKKAKTTK